ncbi:MAG: type II toxin-antitoxin system RelE family toxin [Sciscionella sp.]
MSPAGRYRVEYGPKVLKELSKLDKPVTRSIVRAVNELGTEPRPPGCRALTGYPDLWRIRVGDYRVVYASRTPNPTPRCAKSRPLRSWCLATRTTSTPPPTR